ncbi:MAG: ATP-binding cassette domain-containing protein [Deltaproteobacteria bacterium]|nr:ATP-binding cassette domain-containing protein [Deltaproteobacteria bacterium]
MKLTVSNIYKNYNNTTILNNLTYSFKSDSIYVIMGENGVGKSTFLRICALIENPDAGKIIYYKQDKALKNDIETRRRITLLLPKVGIFNTSVYKNAAYGLKVRGMGKNKIKETACEALDFVGLLHKKDQNALTLSSGETQRLGIARALAFKPEFIFLDEPTASVDYKNTKLIEGIIKKLKKTTGATIIMTTHEKEQAIRVGDKILIIEDTKIRSSIVTKDK